MPTIRPINENQYNALRSNCDYVVMTGNAGGGKTFMEAYVNSHDIYNSPNMAVLFMMRNINQFTMQGGIVDTLKQIYPLSDDKNRLKESVGRILVSNDKMGAEFDNGASMRFKHLADERESTIVDSFKGLQVIKLVFDECDKFKWHTISYATTRMRGKGKGKRQVILAQNSERECFVRQLCGCGENGGGWIGDDGYAKPEMNGVVRYFHMVKGNLDECYWGKTKFEVYQKAKRHIDPLIKGSRLKKNYEDWIFSMVFFTFSSLDNMEVQNDNPDYETALAMSVASDSMYKANWNYSKNDEELSKETEISINAISNMFVTENRSLITKRRITVDPAMEGMDNLVMMLWEGSHIVDIEYYPKCTHKTLAMIMNNFRHKHQCDMSDMIIDVQKEGLYLKEHFPTAQYFSGAGQCSYKGKGVFFKMKDEAGALAAQMINNGLITIDKRLQEMPYKHQKMITSTPTILSQMQFENKIFAFETMPDGKRKMMDKIKQHSVLKGLSPDLMDNIIMWCGEMYYDCYRILADKKATGGNKMGWNIDGEDSEQELLDRFGGRGYVVPKKMINAATLLNKTMGW